MIGRGGPRLVRELMAMRETLEALDLPYVIFGPDTAVTVASQQYGGNIVGGWALGKGGQTIDAPGGEPIPVAATAMDLFARLPDDKLPQKIIVTVHGILSRNLVPLYRHRSCAGVPWPTNWPP